MAAKGTGFNGDVLRGWRKMNHGIGMKKGGAVKPAVWRPKRPVPLKKGGAVPASFGWQKRHGKKDPLGITLAKNGGKVKRRRKGRR